MEKLELVQEWDKTFALDERVAHRKVTFANRYGITLAADMYAPNENATGEPLPAIAVSGPFGAVKEQASGLYAQQLALRGFLAMAFDPSFTGESGGTPRYMASPDVNTEDFLAAVDYLSTCGEADPNAIGILGICGWGGMSINAAALDTRVKATVASTMYDMSRVNTCGYFDAEDSAEARRSKRAALCEQRTADYAALVAADAHGAEFAYPRGGGVVDPLPDDAPQFVCDYHAYYKTARGYHERSLNSTDGWAITGCQSFLNQPILAYASEVESAVMLVHGENAHSRYFSESTYERLHGDNKRLLIVEDAVHTDLYDNLDAIPFDDIAAFYRAYLR